MEHRKQSSTHRKPSSKPQLREEKTGYGDKKLEGPNRPAE